MVSCAKQLDIITAYFVTQGKRRILALKIQVLTLDKKLKSRPSLTCPI